MKFRFQLFILFCFGSLLATAQSTFTGYVKRQDSTVIAAYLAVIEIKENGSNFQTVKSYFDGSYKFSPNKSKTYILRASYPGYVDTTFKITTDKNGVPTPAMVTVVLKKDGMRLLGVIKGKEDDFPIAGAVISVKNVMTRKEDRVTTSIDGYYNIKLDYETNYRISIDKRSPGVINKYQDTAFYISTVGFNQPLDYRLDIALGPSTEFVTPNPDYKPVANQATKPVIEVGAPVKTEPTANNVPVEKTEQPDPTQAPNSSIATTETGERKKKKKDQIETVVIRDDAPAEEAKQKPAKQTKNRTKAETKNKKALNDSIVSAPETEERKKKKDTTITTPADTEKAAVYITLPQPLEDSIQVISDTTVIDSTASVTQLPTATVYVDSTNTAPVVTQQAIQDSTQIINPEILAKELAAKKAYDDSVSNSIAIQPKQVVDTIAQVNPILKQDTLVADTQKPTADSIARPQQVIPAQPVQDGLTTQKAYQDSIARVVLAIQQKAYEDSVAQAKTEDEKRAREAALSKAYEDSVNAVLATAYKLFVEDSIERAKAQQATIDRQLAEKKAHEEFVAMVLAAEKRQQDSIARAQKLALEAAAKKHYEDSVNTVITQIRQKQTQDSIDRVLAEKMRREQEIIRRKILEDSVKQVLAQYQQAMQQHLEESRQKAKQDSVQKAQERMARERKEQEAKREQEAKQQMENSQLVKAKQDAELSAERERRNKEQKALEEKQAEQARVAAEDSLARLKAADQGKSTNQTAAVTEPKPVTESVPVKPQPTVTETGTLIFSANSIYITADVKVQLTVLADKLKQNPALVFDAYGLASAEEAQSVSLSEKRIKAVEEILSKQGVPAGQIKTAWFGNSKALNGCLNPNCPEDLLKQNRVVVYRIVAN